MREVQTSFEVSSRAIVSGSKGNSSCWELREAAGWSYRVGDASTNRMPGSPRTRQLTPVDNKGRSFWAP